YFRLGLKNFNRRRRSFLGDCFGLDCRRRWCFSHSFSSPSSFSSFSSISSLSCQSCNDCGNGYLLAFNRSLTIADVCDLCFVFALDFIAVGIALAVTAVAATALATGAPTWTIAAFG